jgi:hypothetical protein
MIREDTYRPNVVIGHPGSHRCIHATAWSFNARKAPAFETRLARQSRSSSTSIAWVGVINQPGGNVARSLDAGCQAST